MSDEMKLKLMEMFSKGNVKIDQVIFEVKGDNYYYGAMRKDNEKKEVSMETLTKAVNEVLPYFWGGSSYAVVFCVCRDCFNYPDNMSQFERDFNCAPGTLSGTFRNNDYMKLPVHRWRENGAKERVMKLVERYQNAVIEAQSEEDPTE